MNLRTTIVVPCYNEAERLDGPTFLSFLEENPACRFLLVDDGSQDETGAVLESLAAQHERCDALRLPQNSGKAEAVRLGILAARANDPEAIGFWDADLATPLDQITVFAGLLEERPDVEIVIGARVKLLGRKIKRNTSRHYFGRVAAFLVSNMLRLAVYDTQCGAKLFRCTPALEQLFGVPFVTRWAFDVEILARWLGVHREWSREEAEAHIIEHPIPQWTDVAGSKLEPTDFLRTPLDLLRIFLRYRRDLATR